MLLSVDWALYLQMAPAKRFKQMTMAMFVVKAPASSYSNDWKIAKIEKAKFMALLMDPPSTKTVELQGYQRQAPKPSRK